MADAGYPLRWTGYGSLAMAYELPDDSSRPASPNVYSPLMIPKTPPLWSSPYAMSSPSELASPVTPLASFASYSPAAFYSPLLSSSKPLNSPGPSTAYSPSFRPQSPLSPSGSQYIPRTPARLPAELPSAHQVRPGLIVPQKAYSAPFTLGHKPMQIDFRFAGGVLGVPMRMLQDAGAVDLPIEGAETVPFSESVASTITLRIWWPGYLQYSRRMTTRKTTGVLTRRNLGVAVSEVYKAFIEEAREDPKEPPLPDWRVGRGRISLKDLILLRVFQVSQGSWQAEVCLENAR